MSPLRSVFVGYLLLGIPSLIIAILFSWIGIELWGEKPLGAYLIISVLPVKLWVSFMTPRWQRWALNRGVDRERLKQLSVKAMLTWRSDWKDQQSDNKAENEPSEQP